MSIRRLVKHLSTLEKPPVSLNQIRQWIIENHFQDEVWFVPTKKFAKLGGVVRFWRYHPRPYAQPSLVSTIYFDDSLHDADIRHICCKEMLHIFDGHSETTATRHEVEALISGLTSGATLREQVEKLGVEIGNQFVALVVLVPLHLLPPYEIKYRRGDISDSDIAAAFGVPNRFVKLILHNTFRTFAHLYLD